MKQIKVAIDRIEENSIVCISDETGEEIILSKAEFPDLLERDIALLIFEDGKPVSAIRQPLEAEKRLKKNSDRLSRLFDRKK